MSNQKFVEDLCGTEAIGTVATKLVEELDTRDAEIERLNQEVTDLKAGATLEDFYQWAKAKGHYPAYEAVERYRMVLDESES